MFFIEMAVVVRAAAQQEIRFKFTTWYLWPPAEKTPHPTAERCAFLAMTNYTVAEKIIASASMSSNFEALIDVV